MKAVGRTVFLSLGYTRHEPRGVYYREREWTDITHPRAIHGPNLEPSGVEGTYLFLQLVRVREGVIAKIYIALERERELAIDKTPRGSWLVVEPMEYGFEWVQALIEGEHRLGG